jgi:Vitamin B12 dependent methionine synthase, activation domain
MNRSDGMCPQPRFRIVIGEVRSVELSETVFDREELEKILKIKGADHMSHQVEQVMREAENRAAEFVKPVAIYGIFPAGTGGTGWSRTADLVGLALVTIGPSLEREVERIRKSGSVALAMVVDAFGSAWVEGAVNSIDETITQESRIMGLKRDRRRSPGYHPWPLEGQRELFKVLPSGRIGVTLNESCMMQPRKSVSFAVPFFRDCNALAISDPE